MLAAPSLLLVFSRKHKEMLKRWWISGAIRLGKGLKEAGGGVSDRSGAELERV